MSDVLIKRLQQQNLINFFKPFNPRIAHYPTFVIGLLNYILYAMIYKKWELLDDDSPYTRLHLNTFCINSGLSKEIVKYHLNKLSSGDTPLIKRKSYYASTYITFSENIIDCLQIKTVQTHLRYSINNHYRKNKEIDYKPHPLFLEWRELFAIEKIKGDKVKKLFDDNSRDNAAEWAESIVKEICVMAHKENAAVIKRGKVYNVFPHLHNDKFRKKRTGINRACGLIDDLYTGNFFRNTPIHSLFGKINKKHLKFKNTELAVKRIISLKGNKEGIRKFLLRCAKNYFIALQPGMETYQFIKSSFPKTIADFILYADNQKGIYVANFLLFYSSTLSSKDSEIYSTIYKIKELVPANVFNSLCVYEECLLEQHIYPYWQKVYELTKEIKSIINSKGTSYHIESCFDIVFEKVDSISLYHKKLLPGYFDPDKKTANDALIEIKDK
jgi:hypothetical protein